MHQLNNNKCVNFMKVDLQWLGSHKCMYKCATCQGYIFQVTSVPRVNTVKPVVLMGLHVLLVHTSMWWAARNSLTALTVPWACIVMAMATSNPQETVLMGTTVLAGRTKQCLQHMPALKVRGTQPLPYIGFLMSDIYILENLILHKIFLFIIRYK